VSGKPGQLVACLVVGALAGCAAMHDGAAERRRSAYSSSLGPDATTMNRAVTIASDGRYEDAARAFEQLLQRLQTAGGDRAAAAEAMFWLAFCREKQGRFSEAAALYDRVAAEFPDARAADNALQRRRRIDPMAASRPAP